MPSLARSSIPEFETGNPLYIGALVYFYLVDVNNVKTNVLATLYADPTSTTTVANPQALDSFGKFTNPVYIQDPVVITVSGGLNNVPGHDTGVITTPGRVRGPYVAGSRYYPNDLTQDTSSGNIYYATQTFDAISVANDVATGKLGLFLQPADLLAVQSSQNFANQAQASATAAQGFATAANTSAVNAGTSAAAAASSSVSATTAATSAANSSALALASSMGIFPTVVAKVANYNVLGADGGTIFTLRAAGIVMTLPDPVANYGKVYMFVNYNAVGVAPSVDPAGHPIQLAPNNASAPLSLPSLGSFLMVKSEGGAGWLVLSASLDVMYSQYGLVDAGGGNFYRKNPDATIDQWGPVPSGGGAIVFPVPFLVATINISITSFNVGPAGSAYTVTGNPLLGFTAYLNGGITGQYHAFGK